MTAIWRLGQERMLDVYRQARLADLAFKPAHDGSIGLVHLPVQTGKRTQA